MPSQRGRFITFEGGEGAGKSTQVRFLAERLEAAGIAAVVTREPGGTLLGERIRDLVLTHIPEAPAAEFLLFAAARGEHLTVKIAPALASGTWVVCDRFIDSTRVYQGMLGGVAPGLIDAVEKNTVAPHYPDLTIILDVAVDTGMNRARTRGGMNRYDSGNAGFHSGLRDGFLKIARDEPHRCIVIDANRSREDISIDVWAAVSAKFAKSFR